MVKLFGARDMHSTMRIEQHGCIARVLVFLLGSLGSSGCYIPEVDLDGKQCPCSAGWTCDTGTNRCVQGALRDTDAEVSSVGEGPGSDGEPSDSCPAGTLAALGGGCEPCDAIGDRDGDQTADCRDLCPDDRNKITPGPCGCGTSDADTDESGAPDCLEILSDSGQEKPRDSGESDAAPDQDAGSTFQCEPSHQSCMDPDGDGISSDGDLSGVKGNAPCRDGAREECDDNCPLAANPWQDDGDNDGVGDACDPNFCRSSSTLVAVGYGDQIHLSSDHGQSWTKNSPGAQAGLTSSPNWEDVVHGGGTWITDNSNGTAVTWARSVDGETWTVKAFPAWQGLTRPQAVGYADGRWFLGSDDGRLAVSYDDGLNFAALGAPKGWNGTAIEAFAYHAGRLIAVGDAGQIAYSDQPDVASSWHTQKFGVGDFKQIVVVAGLWVAAGKSTCYYSESRGEQWTSCGAPDGTYYGLHYSNGLWMLGNLSSGAWVSRGRPDNWSEQVFLASGGGWPVYGDCGSGRWFAGHRMGDPADYGLRASETEGRGAAPARVFGGQSLPLYGITGN